MKLVRAVPYLTCALLLSGCYSYVPTDFSGVAPGGGVRVHLTPGGVERVESAVGSRHGSLLGEVSRSSADDLVLRVVSASGSPGSRLLPGEIRLLPSDVRELERQEVDRGRTALLVGAVGLVMGLSFYLVRVHGPAGGTPPPGGGTDFLSVPPIP